MADFVKKESDGVGWNAMTKGSEDKPSKPYINCKLKIDGKEIKFGLFALKKSDNEKAPSYTIVLFKDNPNYGRATATPNTKPASAPVKTESASSILNGADEAPF
jgi:hypothetical protein